MKKLIAVTALLATGVNAYEIKGKVVSVTDGDTIKILDASKQQHKIRLADIDAPEAGQPFGQRSKQFLSYLVFSKYVVADCREKDRYGRDVCTVFVGGIDTSAALVINGLAWVYTKYNKRDDLPYLQELARMAKAGLWSAPETGIINPSDWRKGKRGIQEQVRQKVKQQSISADYTCGSKKYCKQMVSCTEAQFYLRQCGLTRLDRDRDSVPCENLCR